MKARCFICETAPRYNGSIFCHNCESQIEAAKKQGRKPRHEKFLVYRGYVVGLYHNGNGSWHPEALKRSANGLPKFRTINLDTYCKGYDRETIKRFKTCVKKLHNL